MTLRMNCQSSTMCRLSGHMEVEGGLEEGREEVKMGAVLNENNAVLFTACRYIYTLLHII